jgi:hypothetical protein
MPGNPTNPPRFARLTSRKSRQSDIADVRHDLPPSLALSTQHLETARNAGDTVCLILEVDDHTEVTRPQGKSVRLGWARAL